MPQASCLLSSLYICVMYSLIQNQRPGRLARVHDHRDRRRLRQSNSQGRERHWRLAQNACVLRPDAKRTGLDEDVSQAPMRRGPVWHYGAVGA